MHRVDASWPPYTIVKSQRSKRLSLRITKYKGLQVIVPKNISQQSAIHFLQANYDWVKKHLHLLPNDSISAKLPDIIHLPLINETWKVLPSQAISQRKIVQECKATCSLYLSGNISIELASEQLRIWLKKKAHEHLPQLVHHYSLKYQLPFKSISIRQQKTRWGSCSREKNINLNSKLLLLSSELSHYIIVHELVHTIHLNHSKAFWKMVQSLAPNYHQQRNELKTIEHRLPNWLY